MCLSRLCFINEAAAVVLTKLLLLWTVVKLKLSLSAGFKRCMLVLLLSVKRLAVGVPYLCRRLAETLYLLSCFGEHLLRADDVMFRSAFSISSNS